MVSFRSTIENEARFPCNWSGKFRKCIAKKGQTVKNTIIDADAAKLAGLKIDLCKKMRRGHITSAHLEWFIGLTKAARNKLVVDSKSGTVNVHVDLSRVFGPGRHRVPR